LGKSCMNMKSNFVFLLIFSLTAALAPAVPARADRLNVMASIFPLYEFAREVAGEDADVDILLPPGASPHTWEPRPSDIVRISRADLFLYVSQEMEPWAGNLLQAAGEKDLLRMEVVKTVGIQGSGDHHDLDGGNGNDHHHPADPHFWLDFSLAARAVTAIGKTMAVLDAANAPRFTARAEEYSLRLMALDREFEKGLAHCRTRIFVTGGHSAFGYLAKRYGLVQIPLYGLSPDAEPTPAYLASVVRKMEDEGIKVVFFEEMVSPRLAGVLATEAGASTMLLVPAGNITARRDKEGATFIGIMKENLSTLREGLSCE